jgi:hypothetical protein
MSGNSIAGLYAYGLPQTAIEQINNTTEKAQYLHHDQAGSTRLITGSTGTVEGAYTYDAYTKKAKLRVRTPTVPTAKQLGTPAPPQHRSATTPNTPAQTQDSSTFALAPTQQPAVPQPSASSTSSSCSAGLTLRSTRATLPSGAITKVVRSLPKYVLPYIDFSTQTP